MPGTLHRSRYLLRLSRSSRWFVLSSLVVAPIVGSAVPLHAQVSFDIGPLVAYYRPLGDFDPVSIQSTALPNAPSDLSALAWGGEAHLTFGRRWGAGAQVSFTQSTVPQVIAPGGPRGPTGAQVIAAAVQAEYDVSPAPEKYRLWFGAGPGLVRHGGDAYERYGSPTDIAGVVGIGLTIPIAAHLRFAVGATTLLYSLDVKEGGANPLSLEHGFQTDALVHVGVRWVAP